MQTIIIISGHGEYATGMKSAFELLAGGNENLYFIDFTVEDTDETLREKFNNIININSNTSILFFCDIMGGTPFKTAALIANDKDNIEVIAGCNLVSLIEAKFQNDTTSIKELAKIVVNSSINSTCIFKKVKTTQVKNIKTEDGI
ncbi:PTS sugar transporter subunit IIA [Clostridium estertheticum]|uniref:PTS sugar transporter subunit IIA n=1 Tax=Clostridium estertheticum TaxID=238834 RepID=UPI0013E940DF|nr:PTS sugar transporter subunit IIA [Clostridium estertheticum]MBZ9686896.1 PTS sugar transporter subunit IIA [Clostridium estertheticum]